MRTPLLLAALLAAVPLSAAPPPPSVWTVGPIVNGRSVSRGLPLRPERGPGHSIAVRIPTAPGSLHGLTLVPGDLSRARRLVLRYRVETAPGVWVEPRTGPGLPPLITFYLQRRGDNWSARGPFETYRWYAGFATQTLSPGGERTMVAPLDGNWTAVLTSSARSSPQAFRAALRDAGAVGIVLGGGDGLGHGIQASGPARLVITEFRIE